jgi:nucleoside-diphosphate-sugar epimerase
VEVLVHLASVQYVSKDLPFFRRARYFSRNNLLSTTNLVNRYAGRLKFALLTSTSMVYSRNAPSPIVEDANTRPNGVYSRSKLAVEEVFAQVSSETAIVRPCIIAGPGRGGLFVPLQAALSRFRTRVIPGSGVFNTSVVHVEDVAALIGILVTGRVSGVFNVAGPDAKSIKEWGSTLARELGVTSFRDVRIPISIVKCVAFFSGYRLLAREQVAMLSRDHVLCIDRAVALGWEPRFSSDDILTETARSTRSKR